MMSDDAGPASTQKGKDKAHQIPRARIKSQDYVELHTYILHAHPTLALTARAGLVNVTIDDTYGDALSADAPQYASEHAWIARNVADGCEGCGARPDGHAMFKQTWHDETTFPGQIPSNVSFSFTGTMLYIYCALANNVNLFHKDTRLAIYLDGAPEPAAQFHHVPDLSADGFIYDQLVFRSAPLADAPHTVLVSNWADGESGSLVLFDYAVYTMNKPDRLVPDSSPQIKSESPSLTTPSPSGSPTSKPSPGTSSNSKPAPSEAPVSKDIGAIIGGSVAAVLAVLLLGAVAFWFLYWRRQRIRFKFFRPQVDILDEERKEFIAPYPGDAAIHQYSSVDAAKFVPSAAASQESLPPEKAKESDAVHQTHLPLGQNPMKQPLVVMAADPADAAKRAQGSSSAMEAPPRYNP